MCKQIKVELFSLGCVETFGRFCYGFSSSDSVP